MKKLYLALAIASLHFTSIAQTGSAWAWDAGKINNNGSVSLKSGNGSSSYNAIQNPTGAVAKVNQSSVTQPPTIIIQATSAGTGSSTPQYSEVIPMLVAGSVIPNCAAGYHSVYSATNFGCNVSAPPIVANMGGTKFSLSFYNPGTYQYSVAVTSDNFTPPNTMSNTILFPSAQCYYSYTGTSYYYSVNICSK